MDFFVRAIIIKKETNFDPLALATVVEVRLS